MMRDWQMLRIDSAARRALFRVCAAALVKVAFLAVVVCAGYAPRLAQAQSLCESCAVQVGLGGTYHFWSSTGSLVLPVSVTWDDNRYEFGVFRFTTQQLLHFPGTGEARRLADPYWGTSLSRRWQVFDLGPVQGYCGFGLALRTESDVLSASRWDFASQVGFRFHLIGNALGEVTMRHWSNGCLELPNHGQDFATLTIRIDSRLFGTREADWIPIDPSLNVDRLLSANDVGAEEPSLP
jgi:hypothetical protein